VNETADSRSYGMSELLDHAALLAHLDAALVVIDRMNARRSGTIDRQHRERIRWLTEALDDEVHTALARAASGRSGEQS
jgi:hypothetical protein